MTLSDGRFPTTSWSLVLAAASDSVPASGNALAALCQAYWFPLYAYVRRKGHSIEDAQDLTQEFFARVLEKHYFEDADPQRGRFRSFLLTSLKHFLANEWDRTRAQKRGRGTILIKLDENAETRYRYEPADWLTPEKIFERQWARTILDRAMARLEQEFIDVRKIELFRTIQCHLTGDEARGGYEVLAADLQMSPGALKVAVHRARRRFGALLRAEVAETVAKPADIENELRHLVASLEE